MLRILKIAFFLWYPCLLWGNIAPLDDLSYLLEQPLDQDCLVILDLDNTLVYSDLMIHQPRAKPYRELFHKIFAERVTPEQKAVWISYVIQQEKLKLVHSQTTRILEQLLAKKIKVLALTARKTGAYGLIESMENERVKQLDALGIAFPTHGLAPLEFSSISPPHNPVYKNGILFTDLLPKHDVLKAWLEKQNWRPRRIIFIDDQLHYLQQIQTLAEEQKISFQGYLFRGIESLRLPFDEKLLEFQLYSFLETGVWLTEEAIIEQGVNHDAAINAEF